MAKNNRETLCGLGSWRPDFLQILASKKVYMFLYGIIGIIKVTNIYAYFVAVLHVVAIFRNLLT